MDKMIAGFPDQLREAVEIGKQIQLKNIPNPLSSVYIAGMGGSGIGGDFVAEWVYDKCPVPIIVGKGYRLPAWVHPPAMAIVSSYSGNTEETLSVYRQLQERKVPIIALTSGGQLHQYANSSGTDSVLVPDNWSSPRACLGFSIVEQSYILQQLGLIDNFFERDFLNAADLLEKETEAIRMLAEEIAGQLVDKFTMIYALEGMEPVALRFRQQLNENSKTRAAHFCVPEMNHNELVGWKKQDNHLAIVYFLSDYDSERNRKRVAISREIMAPLAHSVFELHAKGNSKIEQALYLVYLGDWISWYLAKARGMDSIEVDVIDFLKKSLSEK